MNNNSASVRIFFMMLLGVLVLGVVHSSPAHADGQISLTVNGGPPGLTDTVLRFLHNQEDPDRNFSLANGGTATVDVAGAASTLGGHFYLDEFIDGERFRLQTGTLTEIGNSNDDDAPDYDGLDLIAVRGRNGEPFPGFTQSNNVELDDETYSVTMTYQERARYTVNFDFDDSNTRDQEVSGWTPVGTSITLSAPPIGGYICVGWKDGQNTFPATGGAQGACTFNGTLRSDAGSVNRLTWDYKKAWNLMTSVREAGTANNGPGADALISPHMDQNAHLTVNGAITAEARDVLDIFVGGEPSGSRWQLTASEGEGSLDDDATGAAERRFDLQTDTVLTWLYEKQHKVTVEVDPSAPQAVRDAARPLPQLGDTWIRDGERTTFSIDSEIVDPDTGRTWRCTGWVGGAGDLPLTGDTCSVPNVELTRRSTITWIFGRVHSIHVAVGGVDVQPLPAASFEPDPGISFFPLNSQQTLSADNEVFSADDRFRYVLERWVGTGNVPLAGEALSTEPQTTIGPINLDTNSSVRWIYRKEARLKVAIHGLVGEDPALAQAVECRTADLLQCVSQAGSQPPPPWIFESTDTAPFNYYPVGTQLTLAARFQVTTSSGEVKTAVGINVLSGSLVNSSGLQLSDPWKAEAFTLNAPVELEWDYSDTTRYDVGEAIPNPLGANDQRPRVEVLLPTGVVADDAFFWSPHEGRLYPQRPLASVRLTWFDGEGMAMPPVEARIAWPTERQLHVAQAPVSLAPASTSLVFDHLAFTENAATVSQGRFDAFSTGKSVLRFLDGGTNDNTTPPEFIVVDTVTWDAAPAMIRGRPCVIGTALTDADHSDPEDRNGYVFNELAYYDGFGPDKAYDRAKRRGPILPVNRLPGETDKRMLVVWYQTDPHQIGWPVKPVEYDCQWPESPPRIVIASGEGWRSNDPDAFPDGRIYAQSDRSQPGFNPNEEHALFLANTVYALRNDFNTPDSSDPYVLLKYRDVNGHWAIEVFGVAIHDQEHTSFTVKDVEAGQKIQPFSPLNRLPPSSRSMMVSGETWYHRDHRGGHWAKAADREGDSRIGMAWYYPLQESFFYPDFDNDGQPDASVGDVVPFLGHDGGGAITPSPPEVVTYEISWPAEAPRLRLGETLITRKPGLPDLLRMAAVSVIFDESMFGGEGHLVKLFDPVSERKVPLAAVPATIETESRNGRIFFKDLPFYLRLRLFYDPAANELVFRGILEIPPAGEPLVLLNVMSPAERDLLTSLYADLSDPIGLLFDRTRNPNEVDFAGMTSLVNPYNAAVAHTPEEWEDQIWGLPLGIRQEEDDKNPLAATLVGVSNALTAGTAAGTGFVTLVENDHESLGSAPVALHVIEVVDTVYAGEIKVIPSDNVFDEKLTLRHSADFGGEPERFVVEWYFRPDETGISPPLPAGNDTSGWLFLGRGEGMSEFTIEGADVRTLSDNWVVARYYYRDVFPEPPKIPNPNSLPENDLDNWSPWAGAPGNQQAMLAEGWLKRVVDDLNPLDARVRDFERSPINTLVSMIAQAGEWCGSDVALDGSPENLNNIGIVSAYQTLLRRARNLSIDVGQDYGPANNALLNMATRVSDLYMLLGNEAYADAVDPTIGFTTASDEFGSLAPTIFSFQNQLSSSLEEELTLLRGRDDTASTTRACPVYNRLFWNFTNGDGEVAYVQTYTITDQDVSGVIDEADAKIMFPQGHGDAWGHYLSAMKPWYRLLVSPSFTWEARAESIVVGGVPVLVDYLDERKFAHSAASKAQAGLEIVDLTYRSAFVDDPDGQWQGYKDTDPERAWGLDEWARRVGHGAYLDWVLANAMLPPEDPNPEHSGITKIDRTTVADVSLIASHFHAVQHKLDQADAGLNPLGLARGVVPFDIDPSFLEVGSGVQGLTHFAQIYERARQAVQNAVTVFDYANDLTHSLRHGEDSLDEFKQNLREQETGFKNRLIEIFGYPYSDDIGPGKTYAEGYDGPDWVHFMMVDRSELTGEEPAGIKSFEVTFNFEEAAFDEELGITESTLTVEYPVAEDGPWIVKPPDWTGSRRATGEIQDALSDFMQAEAAYQRSLKELEFAVNEIELAAEALKRRYDVARNQIQVISDLNRQLTDGEEHIEDLTVVLLTFQRLVDFSELSFDALAEALPDLVGTSNDTTAPIKSSILFSKAAVSGLFTTAGDLVQTEILKEELAMNAVQRNGDLQLTIQDSRYEVQQMVAELEVRINAAVLKQYESFALKEAMTQTLGRFHAAVSEGERLLEQRAVQRKNAAAEIQERRYQDLAFRIFRNDAIQKYRAQFDLAARYVYLAAMAYDYETNLLRSDSGAGSRFLTGIFRERSLGQVLDSEPVAGQGGLADILARLGQNFEVYRTQLGFNNPQTETNRFSLRTEGFRIRSDAASDELWKSALEELRVPDLWDVAEFKRYCRPFTAREEGPQPALVIPFSTSVTFGQNFFGWPLAGGDSAYDPTNFATKIRSVGVWFENYPLDQLSTTPRVYLVPVGADVLRSPDGDNLTTRQWNIVDQKLPAPFALGAADLANENWIPLNDSLSEDLGDIRRFPSLRAYRYSEPFDDAETTANSRLIGRSVWNTQWLLIIPGGTLLFAPPAGLDTFMDTVTDIKLFFQTYSYTGN